VLEYHTVSLWLLCNVHFVQSTLKDPAYRQDHVTSLTLKTRIIAAVKNIDAPTLTRVCGKNLNIVSLVAQKKNFYSVPVAVNNSINPLNHELNPIWYLLALFGAHHFLHVSRIRIKSLTFRRLMSYIYMENPFLMFLDHTQRRSTVGRTPWTSDQLVAETST